MTLSSPEADKHVIAITEEERDGLASLLQLAAVPESLAPKTTPTPSSPDEASREDTRRYKMYELVLTFSHAKYYPTVRDFEQNIRAVMAEHADCLRRAVPLSQGKRGRVDVLCAPDIWPMVQRSLQQLGTVSELEDSDRQQEATWRTQ